MTVFEQFLRFVEGLQDDADRSCQAYPVHGCIFPNDALMMVRYSNLKSFADMVEAAAKDSGKSVGDVLRFGVAPCLDEVKAGFSFVGSAIDAIIEEFGTKEKTR